MPTPVDARREAARAFFERLERALRADDVVTDRECVRRIIERAAAEQGATGRKRFDADDAFRHKLLYGKMDEVLTEWCRQREIRTEPFNVFRFEGRERGPTQHETAIGPSLPFVKRVFERLTESVPQLADRSARETKAPTKAITPAFRLQHPLPFGAAGDTKYAGTLEDLERGIYRVAMYAATGGDPSRGWRYDCGLFICYGAQPPRAVLGEPLWTVWEEVRASIWKIARVWAILL